MRFLKPPALLLLLTASLRINGQVKCDLQYVAGEWAEMANMSGAHTNVDSLRRVAKNARGSIGAWNFKLNGTYTYKDSKSGYYYRKNEEYSVDSVRCEILLWSKGQIKNKGKASASLELLYIDAKLMIYKNHDSPTNYYTHILTRK